MSQENSDLRVKRTRVLLKRALLDLCEEKGFNAITVGEIAERAMINRVTFYRHFRDKYELARTVFHDLVEEMEQEMGPVRHTYREIGAAEPSQSYVHFFEYIAAHSRLFSIMMGSDGDPWFASHMREHLSTVGEQRIRARERLRLASPTDLPKRMPRRVAVSIIATTFVGLISWWLEDGMKYSPTQMAAWLQHVIMNGFFGGSNAAR